MTIVLNVPEDIANELTRQGGDLSRAALESLALEGYRAAKQGFAELCLEFHKELAALTLRVERIEEQRGLVRP